MLEYTHAWFLPVVFVVMFTAIPASAEVKFFDGFESGNMLSTGSEGFYYDTVGGGDSNKCNPYNCPVLNTGHEGNYSLMFRYPSGSSWNERRFFFNQIYPEIWISYWLRVPVNFTHSDAGATNNKFFALWTDDYFSTTDPVVVFNYWKQQGSDYPACDTGSAGCSFSTVSISNMTNDTSTHRTPFWNFIRWPQDRGRWMHLVARYKIASSRGAQDGIVQWWRRWENESAYTVLSDRTNLGIGTNPGKPAGFTAGYIMGWVNAPYTEDTDFFVDNFTISDQSLFDIEPGPTFSPCNTVTPANFSQAAYNSYGAPYDLFASNAQLVDAKCTNADTHTINATIGKTGDTTRIVYTKGYYFDPGVNNWAEYSSTCTGTLNGDWCAGPTTATITDFDLSTASAGTPAYFVGMVCSVQGGGWKCGCRDATCTNFYWQIQGAGLEP